MKKIFWIVMVMLLVGKLGFCETSNVQVKLRLATPEIYIGQSIVANVEITNIGTVDLQLPSPDMAEFSQLLSSDNSNLWYSGGVSITSINGTVPTVSVKPGESVSTKINLSGKTHDHSPITFRMGFKTSANAPLVWSNPVTVQFKNDVELPVKVEAYFEENTIVPNVRITNISNTPQNIGEIGVCGLQELRSLISNNPSIKIYSGITFCSAMPVYRVDLSKRRTETYDFFPGSDDVRLKPGGVFEQKCRVVYPNANSGPVSFRIGVKSIGHIPAWSNSITVYVVDGSIYTKSR